MFNLNDFLVRNKFIAKYGLSKFALGCVTIGGLMTVGAYTTGLADYAHYGSIESGTEHYLADKLGISIDDAKDIVETTDTGKQVAQKVADDFDTIMQENTNSWQIDGSYTGLRPASYKGVCGTAASTTITNRTSTKDIVINTKKDASGNEVCPTEHELAERELAYKTRVEDTSPMMDSHGFCGIAQVSSGEQFAIYSMNTLAKNYPHSENMNFVEDGDLCPTAGELAQKGGHYVSVTNEYRPKADANGSCGTANYTGFFIGSNDDAPSPTISVFAGGNGCPAVSQLPSGYRYADADANTLNKPMVNWEAAPDLYKTVYPETETIIEPAQVYDTETSLESEPNPTSTEESDDNDSRKIVSNDKSEWEHGLID